MAVRIIKKSWWVDFRFGHIRYRKRSPENSRAGAQAYEALVRRRLAQGEPIEGSPGAATAGPLFEEFAWKWFETYVKANNKPGTQRQRKSILSASLVPFFGKLPIAQISARHADRFKAQEIERGLAGATINLRLAILKVCLSSAYEWGDLPSPPPRIKLVKACPGRIDYLSREECRLLLLHADGLFREMILVGLRTGIRQGELAGLQWGAIDWQDRSLTVRHSYSSQTGKLESPKSNRERRIPLDSEVYGHLLRRRKPDGFVFADNDGRPFKGERLNDHLTKLCGHAGLRRITWHVLRHTFATQLSMAGVPLNSVQALLGHSAISTTMRYAHVAPSSLRTAIEFLNPRNNRLSDPGQPVVNPWIEHQRRAADPTTHERENADYTRQNPVEVAG